MINLVKMPKKPVFKAVSAGKRERITYKYEYSEKLHSMKRVPSGKIDIFDYIQQSANDVDFKAIGKMLVDTRDNVVDHFNINGQVVDVTGQPRNIHEATALHNKMIKSFDELPKDMKALFNDDFDQFSKAWKSNKIGSVLETYYKSKFGSPVKEPASAPAPAPAPAPVVEEGK